VSRAIYFYIYTVVFTCDWQTQFVSNNYIFVPLLERGYIFTDTWMVISGKQHVLLWICLFLAQKTQTFQD